MAQKPGVSFNINELKVMQSSLQKITDSKYRIQVGIFGEKGARRHAGVTNAEVGFVHEMGSVERKIPQRSFLWDTFTKQGARLNKALAPVVESLFKKGKVDEYLKMAGIAATNLVVEAFDTSGWGAWRPLKTASLMAKLKGSLAKRRKTVANIRAKREQDLPLVDTGQLRGSISFRVVKA